jgi:hypothetical protein
MGLRTRPVMRAAATALALTLCLVASQVQSGVSVQGGLTRAHQVKPGQTCSGTINLRNNGDQAEAVTVYAQDYLFYRDGTSIYGDPGKHERSNANWLTFEPHDLQIPAGATASVSYTLAIPDGQPLCGTYWSVLMVDVPGNSTSQVTSERGMATLGIRQVLRYGIQVVTNIEDSGERKLDFVETKLVRGDDERTLRIDVENVGERWLRPVLWAEIYDKEGAFVGRFDGGTLRIYPGTSVRFKVDLRSVPAGDYKAMVIADCGADDVFGAAYTLRFEDESLTRSQ